jgi:hypothetical protein
MSISVALALASLLPGLASACEGGGEEEEKGSALTVNPNPLAFGLQTKGVLSAAKSATYTAHKEVKISKSSVAVLNELFEASEKTFKKTKDTCSGKTLKPKETCVVEIKCLPEKAEAYVGHLENVYEIVKTGEVPSLFSELTCTGQ